MIMTTAIWSSMNLKRKAKQTKEPQAWALSISLHCLIMSHFRVVYTKLSPLLKNNGKEKDLGVS